MSTTAPVSGYSIINRLFAPYIGERVLNLGCAGNKAEGWDNLDCDPRVGPDIVCRLGSDPIPVPDATYDTVVASHVMEHLTRPALFATMLDLHRVLKPNGYLICITPYGSFDGAWDNPHHHLTFTETTWAYFNKAMYEIEGAGYHAWQGENYAWWRQITLSLVVFPEFLNDPDLEFKKKHYRNVIQELHVVMQAA